jgi:hypothetical protein
MHAADVCSVWLIECSGMYSLFAGRMSSTPICRFTQSSLALAAAIAFIALFSILIQLGHSSLRQSQVEIADLAASILSSQAQLQEQVSDLQSRVGALGFTLNKTSVTLDKHSQTLEKLHPEELPSIWGEGVTCQHEKAPPPPLKRWVVQEDKYLVAGCQIGGFSNRLEALLAGVRLANALQRKLVVALWKELEESGTPLGRDFDPLEVLDLKLAIECAGPGRIVPWEEFVRVKSGLTVLGLCVYFPGGEGRCEDGKRIGEDTFGAPFGKVLNLSGFDVKDIPAEMNYAEDVLWVSLALTEVFALLRELRADPVF